MKPLIHCACELCGKVRMCRALQSGAFCQYCVEDFESRAIEKRRTKKAGKR